ncbi:MAG: hypothetical protein COB04_15095 [Gammaproteobacteria bacterium]|nr:MAG: hypothetical protein COB04_15095 [Gammaproteobacteria bacterium]
MSRVVENWFGEEFNALDPLLQDLHRNGGVLMGKVDIQYGDGLAKFIGKKLAPKLGLPLTDGEHELKVTISHSIDSLVWSRLFNNDHEMTSIFKPHGKQPEGYWSETTGKLSLELGVDVYEGGWYWVQRKVKFLGIPLPLFLFPSSKAYKKIEDGQYLFSVVFSLPVLGKLVGYSGALKKQ